jgi:predicted nucleic acid-binding protein
MPGRAELIYWDSCVFVSYIEGHASRMPDLAGLMEEVTRSNGLKRIATSVVSKVEVAFAEHERSRACLDPAIEQQLDAMWDDDLLELVELHELVARKARDLMRGRVAQGLAPLKPMDAIHLASALWLQAGALHTYDEQLLSYDRYDGLTVCEPYCTTRKLPGM